MHRHGRSSGELHLRLVVLIFVALIRPFWVFGRLNENLALSQILGLTGSKLWAALLNTHNRVLKGKSGEGLLHGVWSS